MRHSTGSRKLWPEDTELAMPLGTHDYKNTGHLPGFPNSSLGLVPSDIQQLIIVRLPLSYTAKRVYSSF